jgi:hypothetical protein
MNNEAFEELDAIVACLRDDAAQLRDENVEDERAANMDRAASPSVSLAGDGLKAGLASETAPHISDRDAEGVKVLHGHLSRLVSMWDDRERPKGERSWQDGALAIQMGDARLWLRSIEAEWVRKLFTADVASPAVSLPERNEGVTATATTPNVCTNCGGDCEPYCCTVYGSRALPIYTGIAAAAPSTAAATPGLDGLDPSAPPSLQAVDTGGVAECRHGIPPQYACDVCDRDTSGVAAASCTYPECECTPHGDVGCNSPNAAARGAKGPEHG